MNPHGDVICGPVVEKEEILYAEVDLRQVTASKRMLDVVGHYARPDVFKLVMNRDPHPVMQLGSIEKG